MSPTLNMPPEHVLCPLRLPPMQETQATGHQGRLRMQARRMMPGGRLGQQCMIEDQC